MLDSDEKETRFKALIQPIRDLASNWDVDIAEELGEYLDELDNIRISLENGHSYLNFAEAALLIQGSTAIYSKKVEYLHQLVLQALELISSHNKSKNPLVQAAKKAASSYMDDDRLQFGSEQCFLLLDDIVEEGLNIDLEVKEDSKIKRANRRSSGRLSFSGDASKTSMILMHALLHDDHGAATLKLSSCHVDITGTLLIGGISSLGNPDTSMHANQHMFHHDQLDRTAMELDSSGLSVHNDGRQVLDTVSDVFEGGENFDAADYLNEHPQSSVPIDTHAMDHDFGGGDYGDYGGDHADFDGGDSAFIDDDEPEVLSPVERLPKRHALTLLDPHEVTLGSKPISKGRTFRLPLAIKTNGKSSKHEERKQLAAEMTPGFVFYNLIFNCKVPMTGLAHMHFDHVVKEERRKLRQEKQKQKKTKADYESENFFYRAPFDLDAVGGARGDGDEEYMFDDDDDGGYAAVVGVGAAAADSARKRIDDLRFRLGGDEEDGGDGGGGGFTDDARGGSGYEDDYDGFGGVGGGDDDGTGYADSNGDGGWSNQGMLRGAGGAGVSAESVGARGHLGLGLGLGLGLSSALAKGSNPYAAMLDEEEQLARRVEEVLNEGLSEQGNSSYELLCRKHIETFMKGADLYARETQLSKRVGEWTSRLEPFLRAQETAPSFDIHEYSSQVLSAITQVKSLPKGSRPRLSQCTELQLLGKPPGEPDSDPESAEAGAKSEDAELVGFEEIVQGRSSAEVCRVFLACLQLSNLGSICVVRPEDALQDETPGGRLPSPRAPAVVGPGPGITSAQMSQKLLEPFRMRVVAGESRMDIMNFRAPSVRGALEAAGGSGNGKDQQLQREDVAEFNSLEAVTSQQVNSELPEKVKSKRRLRKG